MLNVTKSVEIFSGHFPNILDPKKLPHEFRYFATFSLIISERNKISSIGKVRWKATFTPLGRDISMYVCTLVHYQKVIDLCVDLRHINFSKDRISGAKGLCSLKILSLLESDDTLPIHPSSGAQRPLKIFGRGENLKFYQKFTTPKISARCVVLRFHEMVEIFGDTSPQNFRATLVWILRFDHFFRK